MLLQRALGVFWGFLGFLGPAPSPRFVRSEEAPHKGPRRWSPPRPRPLTQPASRQPALRPLTQPGARQPALRPTRLQRKREAAMRKAVDAYARDDHAEARSRQRAAAAELKALQASGARIFSVTEFGAAGDGATDDAGAFRSAVAAARAFAAADRAAPSSPRLKRPVVHVPQGRYLLSIMSLAHVDGIDVRIDGNVVAPEMAAFNAAPAEDAALSPEVQRMRYAFFEIANSTRVRVGGGGSIDGRGRPWWRVRKRRPFTRAPVLLLIRNCIDVDVSLLELRSSPFYHLVILESDRVALSRLNVSSPAGSVNTDGIDVLASRNVRIDDCWVSTGDDNVAIKEGSSYVEVRGGCFARGHGLSIGSLGEGGIEASVRHVALSDVRFVRTTNAARVKTWQGGRGAVENVSFSRLRVAGVGIPVIIDQFYCPASQHAATCANETDAVAIKDVTIDGVTGWHTSGVAAMLHCSDSSPCTVSLRNLDVRPQAGCSNVVRCWSVAPAPRGGRAARADPCARGNAMHGYVFDLSRRERQKVARNFSCIYPPEPLAGDVR